MENLEVENVVKELCEGKELTKQLQTHLRHSSSSSSHQNLEFLLQRILYSYDHALSILAPPSHHPHRAAEVVPDSPRSLAGSPHTEDSDQDQALHPASRKSRKVGVARWSEKIKVGGDEELVGHELDDGYAWRKYGQKDILGAKYPRGYYRCTYRHAQGCLATKQVQRSDDDPTTFEITYRRNHTCNPRANATNNPQLVELDPNPSSSTQNEPAAFNIQTSLRVITPDLAAANDINPSFHPFNFTSSSSINPQNNHTFPYGGTNILEDYNPISTNIEFGGGLIPNLQNSESELSPIVASTTNSPTLGTHFPFGSSGPASDFSFGNSDFFP